MAQLIIAAAGAAIGSVIGGPLGAQIGWALGAAIGGAATARTTTVEGPRLDDLRVSGTEYGQPIAWTAGQPRLAGQIWWASDRREIRNVTRQGKGGGGTKVVTYTYEVDLLIGLCEAVEDMTVVRVWRNGKLVYDISPEASQDTVLASLETTEWARMTFYPGSPTQLPDPTYEAAVGVANAVAYRGRACVFIEGLQLGTTGAIDNLTFQLGPPRGAGALTFYTAFDSQPDGTESPAARAEMMDDVPPTATSHTTSFTDLAAYVGTEGLPTSVYSTALQATITEREPGDDGTLGVTRWIRDPDTDPPEFGRFDLTGDTPGYWLLTNRGFRVVFDSPVNAFGTYMTDLRDFGANIIIAGYVGTEQQFEWNFTAEFGEALTENAGKAWFGFIDTRGPPAYTSVKVSIVNEDPELLDNVGFDQMFAAAIPSTSATLDPVTVRQTVERLCARAGLAAADVDAAPLDAITRPVRALAVGQVAPARSVLEQLMVAYGFMSCLDAKLRFFPRSTTPAVVVPHDDLAAGIDGAQGDALQLQLQSDLELPPQVAVRYLSIEQDFNVATEWSDRLLSGQAAVQTVDLPLGMTAAEAKGVADTLVRQAAAGVVQAQLSLAMPYAALQPGDLVTVVDADGRGYALRIARIEVSGPVHQLECVLDEAPAGVGSGISDAGEAAGAALLPVADTTMRLLDIPLLRDADDTLGHYVAVEPGEGRWSGASIQRSLDGTAYSEVAVCEERAVIGVTTSVLPNWTGGHVFDERSSVTVNVGTALSSSTRAAMLADASINAVLIGDEIVRFRQAQLVSAGVYTLRGLLRGQRGTEWAMGSHAIGERVVLLDAASLRTVSIDSSSLGVARPYKAVSFGQLVSAATAQTFTCNGVRLKPWSPVQLRIVAASGTSRTLTWRRRTRLGTTVGGVAGIVVPLGEASEAYVVQALNASDTVVASVTTTQPQATIDVTGAVRVRVAQISERVGAGYYATLEL